MPLTDMLRWKRIDQVPERVGELQEDGGDVQVQPQVREHEPAQEGDGASHVQDHGAGERIGCLEVLEFVSL